MPTDEELFKIIVQVQGQADVEKLKASVQKQEDAIRLLTAELRLGAISQAQFAASAKAAASQIAAANAQMVQAGAGIGKYGQAIGQLGYAVDDLQYGFKGIANNIQPILSSIPALAKFAGPISIAAIAAYQLYEHWDQLAAIFGGGHIKTASEEMEELRKKTELTADEAERLAKADILTSKVKELRGAKTESEKAETDSLTKAVVENGGIGGLAAGLLKDHMDVVDSQGEAAPIAEEVRAKKSFMAGLKKFGADPGVMAALQGEIDALSLGKDSPLERARSRTAEQMAANATLPKSQGGTGELMAKLFQGTGIGKALAAAIDPQSKDDMDALARENFEQEGRMNAFAFQGNEERNQRAKQFAGNASPAARKIVLGAAASGGDVDMGSLTKQLGSDLAKAGIPEKDVGDFAGRVAQVLMEETRKKLEEEAAKNGTTKEAAAGVGLVDLQIAEANRFRQSMQQNLELTQQDRKSPSVLGSEEFAKSLLSAHPRSDEEIAKKQLDEAQKAVAQLEQIKTGLQNIGRLR